MRYEPFDPRKVDIEIVPGGAGRTQDIRVPIPDNVWFIDAQGIPTELKQAIDPGGAGIPFRTVLDPKGEVILPEQLLKNLNKLKTGRENALANSEAFRGIIDQYTSMADRARRDLSKLKVGETFHRAVSRQYGSDYEVTTRKAYAYIETSPYMEKGTVGVKEEGGYLRVLLNQLEANTRAWDSDRDKALVLISEVRHKASGKLVNTRAYVGKFPDTTSDAGFRVATPQQLRAIAEKEVERFEGAKLSLGKKGRSALDLAIPHRLAFRGENRRLVEEGIKSSLEPNIIGILTEKGQIGDAITSESLIRNLPDILQKFAQDEGNSISRERAQNIVDRMPDSYLNYIRSRGAILRRDGTFFYQLESSIKSILSGKASSASLTMLDVKAKYSDFTAAHIYPKKVKDPSMMRRLNTEFQNASLEGRAALIGGFEERTFDVAKAFDPNVFRPKKVEEITIRNGRVVTPGGGSRRSVLDILMEPIFKNETGGRSGLLELDYDVGSREFLEGRDPRNFMGAWANIRNFTENSTVNGYTIAPVAKQNALGLEKASYIHAGFRVEDGKVTPTRIKDMIAEELERKLQEGYFNLGEDRDIGELGGTYSISRLRSGSGIKQVRELAKVGGVSPEDIYRMLNSTDPEDIDDLRAILVRRDLGYAAGGEHKIFESLHSAIGSLSSESEARRVGSRRVLDFKAPWQADEARRLVTFDRRSDGYQDPDLVKVELTGAAEDLNVGGIKPIKDDPRFLRGELRSFENITVPTGSNPKVVSSSQYATKTRATRATGIRDKMRIAFIDFKNPEDEAFWSTQIGDDAGFNAPEGLTSGKAVLTASGKLKMEETILSQNPEKWISETKWRQLSDVQKQGYRRTTSGKYVEVDFALDRLVTNDQGGFRVIPSMSDISASSRTLGPLRDLDAGREQIDLLMGIQEAKDRGSDFEILRRLAELNGGEAQVEMDRTRAISMQLAELRASTEGATGTQRERIQSGIVDLEKQRELGIEKVKSLLPSDKITLTTQRNGKSFSKEFSAYGFVEDMIYGDVESDRIAGTLETRGLDGFANDMVAEGSQTKVQMVRDMARTIGGMPLDGKEFGENRGIAAIQGSLLEQVSSPSTEDLTALEIGSTLNRMSEVTGLLGSGKAGKAELEASELVLSRAAAENRGLALGMLKSILEGATEGFLKAAS